jgi:nucleotide-binding universal stress UspA family protein
MSAESSSKTLYLALDNLTTDRRLARRLPADLAWRCHALPLAEDNGRVTVAMANPNDVAARDEVISALGPASCLIQANPAAIDALLAQIWDSDDPRCLDVRVCAYPDPLAGRLRDYVQALGSLLDARVTYLTEPAHVQDVVSHSATDYDLVVFSDADHPEFSKLLRQRPGASREHPLPLGLLLARKPRWPIARLLLVLCGECCDEAAAAWAELLTRKSGARATILAVTPPVPAMYAGLTRMDHGLAAMLSTDTPLGHQMRQASRKLVESGIETRLKLREGEPDWQVSLEAVQGEYDLVVLAAQAGRPCWRWLDRGLVGHIVRSLARPVLIAKPARGHSRQAAKAQPA